MQIGEGGTEICCKNIYIYVLCCYGTAGRIYIYTSSSWYKPCPITVHVYVRYTPTYVQMFIGDIPQEILQLIYLDIHLLAMVYMLHVIVVSWFLAPEYSMYCTLAVRRKVPYARRSSIA